MKIKNILITGGAGFIGSHLCKRLLNEENKVICLDNLFTGSKDNIRDFMNHPNFEFVTIIISLNIFDFIAFSIE